MIYDVAVIGAGVIGAHIARQLSRYQIRAALLERCNDVAMGTSKANSAIVHAGFDALPGTLKAKFNVEGTRLMPEVCRQLHIPYKNIGSLLIAFSEEERGVLEELRERGEENGVPGLEIIGREQLLELEPNVSPEAVAALLAPSAGIVCPFELCSAAAESAVQNGVAFFRNFAVDKIDKTEKNVFNIYAGAQSVQARYIVNAAGVHCDEVAALIGDNSLRTTARKGEYLLMDKSQNGLVKHVLFQCPNKMGKGVLVTPTVDGNILVGPSAADVEDKEDLTTVAEALSGVYARGCKSIPALSLREVITSFAGLRAHSDTDDFVIGPSGKHPRFYNVAGIESPGLSAAPAIAVHVAEELAEQAGFAVNESFVPERREPVRFRELTDAERLALIAKDKAYARIVCRCEMVTEGEIRDAIRAPAGAVDLDGVKRRTRSGAGRCQSGFCGPKVLELLSKELDIPWEAVTKFGGESNVLVGKTK